MSFFFFRWTLPLQIWIADKLHWWVHDHKVPWFGPHLQVRVKLFKISEVYSKQIK